MDLMVVRISKTGIMSNATPCEHCMRQLNNAKYVKIKNVYYSANTGSIVCKKFTELMREPNKHVSSGYRMRIRKSGHQH